MESYYNQGNALNAIPENWELESKMSGRGNDSMSYKKHMMMRTDGSNNM